jgi:hypothetical protein
MGVLATWCQLCGLPVQHDHYVEARGGGFNIYRGSMPNGGHDWSNEPAQPFTFGPQHVWLRDAVGVRRGGARPVFGIVEDGGLNPGSEEIFVADGDEDARVYHRFCWDLMGKPTEAADALRAQQTVLFEQLYPYQEQLFDFQRFEENGKGDWLLDPSSNERSRRRIETALAAVKKPFSFDPPTSLAQVLEWDRDWQGTAARSQEGEVVHHVQFRRDPTPRMDLSAYPHLLCFLLEFETPMPVEFVRVEELEWQAKEAIERDASGIVVMLSVGRGQMQLLAYVKDLEEAHRRMNALPNAETKGTVDFDDAHDPTWKIFFEEMGLPAR